MKGTSLWRHLGRHGDSRQPPAAEGDDGPDTLDEAEWPSALKKPVDRAEHTRSGESQDEQAIAPLERVAHEHCRDGE